MIDTLFLFRPLINAAEIRGYAQTLGFEDSQIKNSLHVTLAFSKTPVDWDNPVFFSRSTEDTFTGGALSLKRLEGDASAVVLTFIARPLSQRWGELVLAGASWDFDNFVPHITLATNSDVELLGKPLFNGAITLDWEMRQTIAGDISL